MTTSSGEGGAGGAGGQGGAPVEPECLVPGDCPGTDGECSKRTCEAGVCGVAEMPTGTPCSETCLCDWDCGLMPDPGGCGQGLCQAGSCVATIPVTCMTPQGTWTGCEDLMQTEESITWGLNGSGDGSCHATAGSQSYTGYCEPGTACTVHVFETGAINYGTCL